MGARQAMLDLSAAQPPVEPLAPGAVLLRGFAADTASMLVAAIDDIAAQTPFRHMVVPGGHAMSAAMTNCGGWGWTATRRRYRYEPADPETGRPWPEMPEPFRALAARAADAAGYPGFAPDSCLINRYAPGARMGLHHDSDETDRSAPIVSVSLGLPAVFLWGGLARKDRPRKLLLESGDIVVWGGPARLAYHGVEPVAEGEHPLTGPLRYNFTFRKAR